MQNSLQYEANHKSSLNDHRSKRSWTHEEQDKFKSLYKQYKKDFGRYVPHLEGRTEGQIKSFYQNVVHNNIQISRQRQFNNTAPNTTIVSETQTLIVFSSVQYAQFSI
ncbi:Conserved_hypothetical protein [Hexamita inflata]|uniref:HTH myb-type domain-containing protein n=1 Tax=Hexamita inflata TaxID=28002 RepID=A0AA86UIW1_9EUKA|nr:Conserved hypothetical protein [Hexamita inflata]